MPELISGELPSETNQALISNNLHLASGYRIGETIRVGNGSQMIVGIYNTPATYDLKQVIIVDYELAGSESLPTIISFEPGALEIGADQKVGSIRSFYEHDPYISIPRLVSTTARMLSFALALPLGMLGLVLLNTISADSISDVAALKSAGMGYKRIAQIYRRTTLISILTGSVAGCALSLALWRFTSPYFASSVNQVWRPTLYLSATPVLLIAISLVPTWMIASIKHRNQIKAGETSESHRHLKRHKKRRSPATTALAVLLTALYIYVTALEFPSSDLIATVLATLIVAATCADLACALSNFAQKRATQFAGEQVCLAARNQLRVMTVLAIIAGTWIGGLVGYQTQSAQIQAAEGLSDSIAIIAIPPEDADYLANEYTALSGKAAYHFRRPQIGDRSFYAASTVNTDCLKRGMQILSLTQECGASEIQLVGHEVTPIEVQSDLWHASTSLLEGEPSGEITLLEVDVEPATQSVTIVDFKNITAVHNKLLGQSMPHVVPPAGVSLLEGSDNSHLLLSEITSLTPQQEAKMWKTVYDRVPYGIVNAHYKVEPSTQALLKAVVIFSVGILMFSGWLAFRSAHPYLHQLTKRTRANKESRMRWIIALTTSVLFTQMAGIFMGRYLALSSGLVTPLHQPGLIQVVQFLIPVCSAALVLMCQIAAFIRSS